MAMRRARCWRDLALPIGDPMLEDLDPAETREWVDALDSVLAFEGADRAFLLLDEVIGEARRKGARVPYSATTPYLNTIPPEEEDRLSPEELALDHRVRSLVRWNALAIVLRANAESSELGGHIASFQSRRRLKMSASSISSAPPTASMAVTCCSFRATPRRAFTPARSWRAG